MDYLGNQTLLTLEKTAFLCSRQVPAQIVLRSYDWAKEQRRRGTCVVCGNHSQIEKDVFEILLRGTQPLILVLARGMKKHFNPAIQKALDDDRLLIISPFDKQATRITRQTAKIRNQHIIQLSDFITVAYKTPGGHLDELLIDIEHNIV